MAGAVKGPGEHKLLQCVMPKGLGSSLAFLLVKYQLLDGQVALWWREDGEGSDESSSLASL